MNVAFNNLQRRYEAHSEAIDAVVATVLRSGWYVMGQQHDSFELELAQYVGTDHCVAVGSGTDALTIALSAFQLPPAAGVVTVANAGGYTTVACQRLGLTPLYADVDAGTASMTVETLAAAATDEARAVVVTHLYGQMADIDPIAQWCRDRGLLLLEDCAQSIGARDKERQAGSFGDAAAFSFYPTKNLGALGDGGAIVTNNAEIADCCRSLRQYGWGREKYVVTRPGGVNSRLDEIQAAVLRCLLPHVDVENERRRAVVRRYADALDDSPARVVGRTEEASYVGHLAVVAASDRAAWREQLLTRGVGTAIHYPVPDHRQPIASSARGLPVTETLADTVFSLPCYPELTDAEVDWICDSLRSAAREIG